METYLLKQNTIGNFILSEEAHERAFIQDARNEWTFEKSSGFETVEDVLTYVEEYFKLSRAQIKVCA